MSIRKEPSGRFRAALKDGRVQVMSKTFDTRREAAAWLARERTALAGGVSPTAGRRRVRDLLPEWVALRRTRVSSKTARTDADLLRLLSPGLGALNVNAVGKRHVEQWFDWLRAGGLARSSVVRHRASLSAFFAWCVDEQRIVTNPVAASRVPSQVDETVEMTPFAEAELEDVYASCYEVSPRLADVVLVLGWTGLRWGEARALRVSDVVQIPTPALRVARSQTEGGEVKTTKSRRVRRVPVADRILPLIIERCAGRPGDAWLLTGVDGGQLWRSRLTRSLDWPTRGRGRRIHDLRHTAACLWLARGVDPGTVQAWMGHESIATTNRYLHHLGTAADVAGLERLNRARSDVVVRGECVTGESEQLPTSSFVPEISKRPSQR